MHEQFANAFYSSQAWKNCRAAYAKYRGYMCERCRKRGLIVTDGLEVHHKIRITPQNIHDARITLSFQNLELLCRRCHQEEHNNDQGRDARRWDVDETGKIVAR